MCPAMRREEGKRESWSTALQSVPRQVRVESCDGFRVLRLTWVLGFPLLKYYLCVIPVTWRSCSSSDELLWLHVECFCSGMLLQYLLFWFWVSRRNCIANATFRQAEERNGDERACWSQTGEAPSKSRQCCVHGPSVSADKLCVGRAVWTHCISFVWVLVPLPKISCFSPCLSSHLYKMGMKITVTSLSCCA